MAEKTTADLAIEYMAAFLKELRTGNQYRKNRDRHLRVGTLTVSSGRVDLNPHNTTDALGNARPNSADIDLIEYPDEWDACKEGDPPTGETLMLHVDYDVQENEDTANTDSIETAFIEVTWGGYGHRREFDLQRGLSIPLTGQRVIVKLGYPIDTTLTTVLVDNLPHELPWTQPGLKVRGSLGRNAASGNPGISGNARRTVRYGTVNGQNTLSAVLPIPPWATAVNFQSQTVANTTLEYRQFANDVAGAQVLSAAQVGKGDDNTVPIAAGARFAAFFNGAVAAVPNVKAIYYLGG